MPSHFYFRNHPEAAKQNYNNLKGKRATFDNKLYAYYVNDELIAEGNMDQLVEKTGLKRSTLFNYASPARRRADGSYYNLYRYVLRLN